MSGHPTDFPDTGSYVLRNARVPTCLLAMAAPDGAAVDADGAALLDLTVEAGTLARVAPAGAVARDLPAFDLKGRHAWPRLVDMHTHLDKGHTVARTPNPDGDFPGARDATTADREAYWDADDLRRRMAFGLACAEAHGVGAIRTHLDSQPGGPKRDQVATTWAVFREMRDAWASRIELQAVALMPLDAYLTPHGPYLADTVAAAGGLMGGVTRPSGGLHGGAGAAMDGQLDALFALAKARDLDVDLHVDETGDPAATSLEAVARATLRHGYEGRVVCGHCCSLAVQAPEVAAKTIALVAKAGIAIVTLPPVNMYLQDRQRGRTPRWRGVAPVHELVAAGVRVAVAGDNCRDAFYAYGDHDMLDTLRAAVRILHYDHPFEDAAALAASVPAGIIGAKQAGVLRAGGPADLILIPARTLNEVMTRTHADRIVLVGGKPLAAKAPAYEALDGADAAW
jgi:cytosine deaminase